MLGSWRRATSASKSAALTPMDCMCGHSGKDMMERKKTASIDIPTRFNKTATVATRQASPASDARGPTSSLLQERADDVEGDGLFAHARRLEGPRALDQRMGVGVAGQKDDSTPEAMRHEPV